MFVISSSVKQPPSRLSISSSSHRLNTILHLNCRMQLEVDVWGLFGTEGASLDHPFVLLHTFFFLMRQASIPRIWSTLGNVDFHEESYDSFHPCHAGSHRLSNAKQAQNGQLYCLSSLTICHFSWGEAARQQNHLRSRSQHRTVRLILTNTR